MIMTREDIVERLNNKEVSVGFLYEGILLNRTVPRMTIEVFSNYINILQSNPFTATQLKILVQEAKRNLIKKYNIVLLEDRNGILIKYL